MVDSQISPLLASNEIIAPMVRPVPEGLLAHAPTTLRLPIPAQGRLQLGFGVQEAAWNGPEGTSGVCFEVVVPRSGTLLWERCLRPRADLQDRGGQVATIEIPREVAELHLTTKCIGSCAWAWSYWSKAEFTPQ
jgi:hypothetical protein